MQYRGSADANLNSLKSASGMQKGCRGSNDYINMYTRHVMGRIDLHEPLTDTMDAATCRLGLYAFAEQSFTLGLTVCPQRSSSAIVLPCCLAMTVIRP